MRVHIAKTIDSKVYTISFALPNRFFPFSLWWWKKALVSFAVASRQSGELRNMILDRFISHMRYSRGVLLALWTFNLRLN